MTNAIVIAQGCSYAANLATYFRMRYPHVAVGSYASSPGLNYRLVIDPLSLLRGRIREIFFSLFVQDFEQLLVAEGETISKVCGQDVYNAIQTASSQMAKLFETSEGRDELQALFNTCLPFTDDPRDFSAFTFGILGNWLASFLTYNQTIVVNLTQFPDLCRIIESDLSNPLKSYATAMTTSVGTCLSNSYQYLVFYFQQVMSNLYADFSGVVQTLFLQCSQMGYFTTTGQLQSSDK